MSLKTKEVWGGLEQNQQEDGEWVRVGDGPVFQGFGDHEEGFSLC